LIDGIANFKAAVSSGEDPIAAAKELALHILESHVQNINYLAKNTYKRGEADDANESRDYRVYQELSGLKDEGNTRREVNPAMGINERKFNKAETPEEAAALLPEIMDKLIEKFGDNPEILRNKLSALGSTQLNFPDPEKLPIQAMAYYSHLEKIYGEDGARQRMEDYYKKNVIKNIKRSMVPKI